jgi:hypothetical protein
MRIDTDYQTQELKNVVEKVQNRLLVAWKTNNTKEIEICIDTLNHIQVSITLPKGERTYAVTY